MHTRTNQIAESLIVAHATGIRTPAPSHLLSRAEILQIQSSVATSLGPVAGFKVGRAANGPPILAPLPACYNVANGDNRQVRDRLGIELEIGFKVIRPLPRGRIPTRPQDYLRPYAVLELVDSRFVSDSLTAEAKFCDFQMTAGLVVGTGLYDWDGADFNVVQALLETNTGIVMDDVVSVPGNSALANLELLMDHLGTHCGGVQVGQILITGSLNGLPYFQGGQSIQGTISGLGQVSVTLEDTQTRPG